MRIISNNEVGEEDQVGPISVQWLVASHLERTRYHTALFPLYFFECSTIGTTPLPNHSSRNTAGKSRLLFDSMSKSLVDLL